MTQIWHGVRLSQLKNAISNIRFGIVLPWLDYQTSKGLALLKKESNPITPTLRYTQEGAFFLGGKRHSRLAWHSNQSKLTDNRPTDLKAWDWEIFDNLQNWLLANLEDILESVGRFFISRFCWAKTNLTSGLKDILGNNFASTYFIWGQNNTRGRNFRRKMTVKGHFPNLKPQITKVGHWEITGIPFCSPVMKQNVTELITLKLPNSLLWLTRFWLNYAFIVTTFLVRFSTKYDSFQIYARVCVNEVNSDRIRMQILSFPRAKETQNCR